MRRAKACIPRAIVLHAARNRSHPPRNRSHPARNRSHRTRNGSHPARRSMDDVPESAA
jgi:hypothetical protein